MIKIYKANQLDEEGKSIRSYKYFLDEDDALDHLGWTRSSNSSYSKNNRYFTSLDIIEVWEKGEYSLENEKKRKALAKLTIEERELLGL